MFFFSKNKPVLKDLIPDNHIDIHSHLLPGIDDGARTFEDTLQLVRSLQGFGISEFVTTPHIMQYVWDNTREAILSKATTTVVALQTESITVPFRAAAEYLMDDSFERLFKANDLLTLKDNLVLVEMSYINPPMQLYSILFELQVAGYIPVLAHPERYLFYQTNFNEYVKLKNAGCLFQLNLLSVVGYYGDDVAKVAAQLLKKGMYTFVGSDVHHARHIAAFEQRVTLKDLVPLHEVLANNQFFKL